MQQYPVLLGSSATICATKTLNLEVSNVTRRIKSYVSLTFITITNPPHMAGMSEKRSRCHNIQSPSKGYLFILTIY